jgi:ABC-type amino acid transport substrate-binding protein
MSLSAYIFTLKDSEIIINSWSDLENLEGVAHRGTVFSPKFNEYAKKHLSISLVNSPIMTLKMLAFGRADYALHHLRLAKLQIETLGISDQITISKKPLGEFTQAIHFAFSKRSKCKHLSFEFEEKLSKYLENHDIETLLDEHTQTYLHYLNTIKTQAAI